MPHIERRHLRDKAASEDRLIADQIEGMTASQLAAEADEWIVHALNVLYDPNHPERLSTARRALVKAHGRARAAAERD